MSTPTVTTNRLHFEDLDPRRFEELGFQLLQSMYDWRRLDHTGVCGNDGGVDIYGVKSDGTSCYCQVKRYQRLTQSDIKKIYNAIIQNNVINPTDKPHFILICACDLSKQVLDTIYTEGYGYGFGSIQIFSRTKLEGILYNDYRSILERFFGRPSFNRETTAVKIRKQLAAKKKVIKLLIRKDLNKIPYETIAANPGIQFVTDKLVVVSAISSFSLDKYGDRNNYDIVNPLNFEEEGLELLLPAIDNIFFNLGNNTWRKSNGSYDSAQKDEVAIMCQLIGILPYYKIADIEVNGDSYYSCPIIHCIDDTLRESFSKITHRHYNLGIIFDEKNQLSPAEIRRIRDHVQKNNPKDRH